VTTRDELLRLPIWFACDEKKQLVKGTVLKTGGRPYDGIDSEYKGLRPGDGVCILDLDHCLDGDNVAPWAQGIIDQCPDAYVERSIGREGLHVIGRATLPGWDIHCDEGEVTLKKLTYVLITFDEFRAAGSVDSDIGQVASWLKIKYLPEKSKTVGRGERRKLPDKIEEGERNSLMYQEACRLRRDGRTEEEILGILKVINRERVSPPLPENELTAVAEQAAKYEPNDEKEKRTNFWVEEFGARDDARDHLKRKKRPPVKFPEILSLDERLARPREKPEWRIENLQIQGQRVVLAAQFKAGKTELRDNRIRSLVDDVPFLGEFETTPLQGRAVILDFEMPENMVDDWLDSKEIKNQNKVVPIPMRGLVSVFDIFDEELFAFWVEKLRKLETEDLTLDCLRPVLDALGLDENHEAGKFLVKFSELLEAAKISEALVVHHMGHEGTRSRGDSRILDWPDATWNLKRGRSARYFSAEGRDVSVPEQKLHFDPETRILTTVPGDATNEKQERAREILETMVTLVETHGEPIGQEALVGKRPHGISKADAREAIKIAEADKKLECTSGPRNAKLYTIGPKHKEAEF